MSNEKNIQQELIELTLKCSRGEGVLPTDIPQIFISRGDRPSVPVHSMLKPTLCFIVQGEKDVVVGDQNLTYGPSQYLITTIDIPVAGQITKASPKAPYLCIVLELDSNIVYDIVKKSEFVESNSSPKNGFYVDKVSSDLSNAFLRLMRTYKNKNDALILSPLIIHEITYLLLGSKYGSAVRQLGIAGSQIQRITKAIELIKKNYSKPLRIEELAKISSMSTSTFHHHFKQATAMSPLQFQKQIRLQEARILLSSGAADAANAAFEVGYESASQFSREYARMFGLPPKSDMKRLKEAK